MDDLKGKESTWWAKRWRTYINVNLESIVILCNWVDRMNSVKEFQTLK